MNNAFDGKVRTRTHKLAYVFVLKMVILNRFRVTLENQE